MEAEKKHGPNFGKKFSEEWKQNLSKAKRKNGNKLHKWTSGLESIDPRPHPTKRGLWIARELNDRKQKATARGIEWTIQSLEAAKLLTQECYYCGIKFDEPKMGIDRIDNSKGYVSGNCRSCCKHCNSAKMENTQDEFYDWAERLIKNLKNKGLVSKS